MKKIVLLLACALVFSVFTGIFLIENCMALGNTIYVDDSNTGGPWNGTQEHPYQYIQDGIDGATSGDIVYVYSGTYNENVEINENIGKYRFSTEISDKDVFLNVYFTGEPGTRTIKLNRWSIDPGIQYRIWATSF